MRDIDSNALFVRDGERVGIVTGMNLSKAVVLNACRSRRRSRARAFRRRHGLARRFRLPALLQMTKHNKRRVAVHEGDASSAFSRISICSASSPAMRSSSPGASTAPRPWPIWRSQPARSDQVRMLRRQGVKVEVVAEIVSDLNRRLFARLFEMLARPNPRRRLPDRHGQRRARRTDDAHRPGQRADPRGARRRGELLTFPRRFSAALEGFGFPPCPGNVMVRNPFWSKPLDEYVARFPRWRAARRERAYERRDLL